MFFEKKMKTKKIVATVTAPKNSITNQINKHIREMNRIKSKFPNASQFVDGQYTFYNRMLIYSHRNVSLKRIISSLSPLFCYYCYFFGCNWDFETLVCTAFVNG